MLARFALSKRYVTFISFKWAELDFDPAGERTFDDDDLRLLQNIRAGRLDGPGPFEQYSGA